MIVDFQVHKRLLKLSCTHFLKRSASQNISKWELTHPLAGFTVMAYGSPAMSVISRVQFGPLSCPTFMEYRNFVQWAV